MMILSTDILFKQFKKDYFGNCFCPHCFPIEVLIEMLFIFY